MAAIIRAVMVDMDGTLIDSMPYWRRAERIVCAECGCTLPEDDGFGLHLLRDMDMVCRGTGHTMNELWDLYRVHMHDAYRDTIPLRPGARAYIEALVEAGLPVWLVTGSKQEDADAVVARCGVAPLLNRVMSMQGHHLHKNNPAFFHWMAGELGIITAELLVLEDDPTFSRAAKDAGCVVYGLHDPAHDARAVMEAQCDAFAEDFASLPNPSPAG